MAITNTAKRLSEYRRTVQMFAERDELVVISARIPKNLRDRLEHEAKAHGRPLSVEICLRLALTETMIELPFNRELKK